MRCKNCQNIYNLSNEDDEIVGKWCPKISDSPDIEYDRECDFFKPMTNADRIRNMTDEELAEFLVKVNSTIQDCMVLDCKCENTDKDCKDCFLEWLQAEVKEGET